MTMQDDQCLRRAERRLAALVAETCVKIQSRTKGMRIILNAGEYAGREAIIDGVTLDAKSGGWLFCCWVLRADGSGLLNTDSYHIRADFTLKKKEADNDG